MIKSWSSTQQIFCCLKWRCRIVCAHQRTSQTKGIISMLMDFDLKLDGKVCTVASAAIGISYRPSLGRTRHMDVQYLWIQDELEKVGTKDNLADVLTKLLPHDVMLKHLLALDIELGQTGRRRHLNLCEKLCAGRWLTVIFEIPGVMCNGQHESDDDTRWLSL